MRFPGGKMTKKMSESRETRKKTQGSHPESLAVPSKTHRIAAPEIKRYTLSRPRKAAKASGIPKSVILTGAVAGGRSLRAHRS
jgi:hypothetical protein